MHLTQLGGDIGASFSTGGEKLISMQFSCGHVLGMNSICRKRAANHHELFTRSPPPFYLFFLVWSRCFPDLSWFAKKWIAVSNLRFCAPLTISAVRVSNHRFVLTFINHRLKPPFCL